MNNFINLNVHSYYSLLMSSISIDDIILYAVKNKQKYVSLIDIKTMYGSMEFYQKAIKNNLKPIIGLQITYQEENVILIAKNFEGYQNLMKISSFINTNTSFELNKYIDNLLVIVKDVKNIKWTNNINDNFYSYNQSSFNPIAIRECFYLNKQDLKYVKALYAIKNNLLYSDTENITEYDDKFFLSNEQAQKQYSLESLNNLNQALNKIDLIIPSVKKNHLINYVKYTKYSKNHTSKELLTKRCADGLQERLGSTKAPKNYIDRLKHELQVIDEMGFNDYFLIVQDYVNFAKQNNILTGPGRGSAAGSLVSYVLGITQIDPIKNNLIFERFLNPQRQTMPDIDIDFMDDRRNEIIDYIFSKYGSNHVAHIIIFQTLKIKMAIRDVARIFGYEMSYVNKICKEFSQDDIDVNNITNNNIKNIINSEKNLFDFVFKFINFPRQIGMHAAGIVLSDDEINSIVPTTCIDGIHLLTQYSMEYLEELGLIKIDILGLSNLTTIHNCINIINKTHVNKKSFSLDQIPLDDKQVFDELSKGKTVGIFQLESPGMTNLIKRIKPINIEDISITSALFRPGPQKQIETYLKNRQDPQNIKYLNDDFKKILSFTYNIIIYQEQLIQIICLTAKYNLASADTFRRIISKKDHSKLAGEKKKFIEAAINNKYSEADAKKIYEYIEAFANYGFNHSHSLSYSYISYWMAYLKFKYPLQFYTTLLSTNINNIDKVSAYTTEAINNSISVLPPSINLSEINFSIKKNKIYFGLNAIKGIGYETAKKIINLRKQLPEKKFDNIIFVIASLVKNGIGIKTLEILLYAGLFDELIPSNHNRLTYIKNLEEIFDKSQFFNPIKKEFITGEPKISFIEQTNEDNELIKKREFELLNVNLINNDFDKIRKNYKGSRSITNLIDIKEKNKDYWSIVYLINIKKNNTKYGTRMSVLATDNTKTIEIIIYLNDNNKELESLKANKLYVMNLKLNWKEQHKIIKFEEYE